MESFSNESRPRTSHSAEGEGEGEEGGNDTEGYNSTQHMQFLRYGPF